VAATLSTCSRKNFAVGGRLFGEQTGKEGMQKGEEGIQHAKETGDNMLKRQACERPKFFKSQNQPCRNQKDVTASEVSQRFL
jgi:hypothetical protein